MWSSLFLCFLSQWGRHWFISSRRQLCVRLLTKVHSLTNMCPSSWPVHTWGIYLYLPTFVSSISVSTFISISIFISVYLCVWGFEDEDVTQTIYLNYWMSLLHTVNMLQFNSEEKNWSLLIFLVLVLFSISHQFQKSNYPSLGQQNLINCKSPPVGEFLSPRCSHKSTRQSHLRVTSLWNVYRENDFLQ